MEKENKEIKSKNFDEETKTKSKDKELYWILGVMFALIFIFVISASTFKSLNKFDYQGLSFAKEKFGEIPVYHAFYFYKNPGITGSVTEAETVKYNLFLRVDPRENNVPVDGEIELRAGQQTFVSVDPYNLTGCEYSSIAIANLASFLGNNLIPV